MIHPAVVPPTHLTTLLVMTTFSLRHHGSDIPYQITVATYDDSGGLLDVELLLELTKDDVDEAPPEILIRLTNLEPAESSEFTQSVQNDFADDDYFSRPNAFVYSGFHHTSVTYWFTIDSRDSDSIIGNLRVVTDDVDHYDEDAVDDVIFGSCTFSRGDRAGMWGP